MEILNQRILFAVLNWGLGHATRSIPLIRKYLLSGNEILIASDGIALAYLNHEFPELPTVELPSYKARYPTKSSMMNMLLGSSSLFKAIHEEKKMTRSIVDDWKPDLILSDHRYGCHDKGVKSIIIAHQIQLRSNFFLAQFISRKLNYYLINQFDECWIPDMEGKKRLSGDLSSSKGIQNYKYIGPLSRFIDLEVEKIWDVLIILSGPEPSRSRLEQILLKKIQWPSCKICFVRGSNAPMPDYFTCPKEMKMYNILQSEALNKTICASKFVICRSGYSSIMDLECLSKKALLIPTPGQSEQEYLAEIHKGGKFQVVKQNQMEIQMAVQELIS